MDVTLKPLEESNWREVAALSVATDQEDFVPSNDFSIGEASRNRGWIALGIYAGDEPVGLAIYGPEPATAALWLVHFMIDGAHQHRGYGKAALALLIERIRGLGVGEFHVSFKTANAGARRLYEEFGFEKTGESPTGDTLARMRL